MLRRLLDLFRSPSARRPPRGRSPEPVARPSAGSARAWTGPVEYRYSPDRDGRPDPGEIVWTWVPYEEDPAVGKDRPVAIVGLVDGGGLAVVSLSSKDHDGQRGWLALGAGPWDRQHRPSWVRTDRVLVVAPDAVRREGSALDRERYDRVVAALQSRGRGH